VTDTTSERNDEARRLQVLADASGIFAATGHDLDSTLEVVARRCAEAVGDSCIVQILLPGGQELDVRAFHHVDPEALELARELFMGKRVDATVGINAEVIRTRAPVVIPRAHPAALQAATHPTYQRFMRRFPVHSVIAVPLRAGGEVLGVMALARYSPDRPYGSEEERLMTELADRAAVAIRNARSFADEVRSREAAEQAAERIARLQATTAALARVRTARDVGQAILDEGLAAFGAFAGAVYLLEDGRLEPTASRGIDPARIERLGALDLDLELPITCALRGRESIFCGSRAEILARFAGTRHIGLAEGTHAVIALPLVADDRPLGAIAVTFDRPREFEREDRELAEAVAQQCSQAVDRALLLERERRAGERAAFLARAGEVLSTSLDAPTILEQLARLAVPDTADWCVIELAGAELVVAHADPAKVRWARELRERFPPDPDAPTGAFAVMRSGEPELYAEITEELLARSARSPEHLEVMRKVGLRSALVVPMKTGGRTIGALSLVWSDTPRRYGRDDVDFTLDLAHRAALAVENARLYGELRRAVQSRDDFLAVAGHELKTPLAALLLHLDGMLRQARRDGAAGRLLERLEKAAASGARLDKLINQVLDVSRITAGRLELEPEELELDRVVGDIAERLGEASARTIAVRAQRVMGVWDRGRMEQVVTNLLANAIKYGQGRPIDVELAAERGDAVLRVRDRGIGIDPAQQQRVFERFERAVDKREFGGLGLGLWIARQIVEASGGSIAVESAPGQGSTFTVRLPLATRSASESP
jgi:signal transduction histidine kinase